MHQHLFTVKKWIQIVQSGPVYGAVVIGSALFLIALAACRWRSDSFTAEAQLTLTRKSLEAGWPSNDQWERIFVQSLSDQVTTERNQTVATKRLSPKWIGDDKKRSADSIVLRIDSDSTPLFLNVTLFCVDRNPEAAIHWVNRFGNQLIASDFSAKGVSLPETQWHMSPAKKAIRKTAPLSLGTLLGCLALATVLCISILLWNYLRGALQTRHAVERILKTRVLGHLPSSDLIPHGQTRNFIYRTCAISEWTLIVMLLAALAASLMDKHFAHQFVSQPVSALADSVRQLTEITWS